MTATQLWVTFDDEGHPDDTADNESAARDYAFRSGHRTPVLYIPAECPGCGESAREYGFLFHCKSCNTIICENCGTNNLCMSCDVDAAVAEDEDEDE
jgi:hypothetical protein